MILLDSNVLLYAAGGEHELRAPCLAILGAVGSSAIDAVVTDVVLTEVLHARARRSSRTEAANLVASITQLVAEVFPLSDAARERALSIYAASERLSSNDAFIAAVALERDLTLVSADGDFADVPGLALAEPTAFAVGL